MSAGKTMKFKGSRISVGSTLAAPDTITGISKASTAVVTATAHGIANGAPVYITGVVGMTEVNDRWFIAVNVAVNTFELKGVDSTGFGVWVSGGTAVAAVFANWCEIKDWNVSGGQSDEVETTTHCSDSKSYETGLADFGSVQSAMNYVPNTTIQQFIENAQISGDTVPMRVTFPGTVGSNTYLMGITQQSHEGSQDGVIWTGSFSARIKQRPHFQPGV